LPILNWVDIGIDDLTVRHFEGALGVKGRVAGNIFNIIGDRIHSIVAFFQPGSIILEAAGDDDPGEFDGVIGVDSKLAIFQRVIFPIPVIDSALDFGLGISSINQVRTGKLDAVCPGQCLPAGRCV